jgi:hypothetical protein
LAATGASVFLPWLAAVGALMMAIGTFGRRRLQRGAH